MKSKKLVQSFAVVTLATLTMANSKCEKPVETRTLKKNVKVISVEASTSMDSSSFNFAEQAQVRVSSNLFSTPYFYERNFYPKAEDYQDEQRFNAIQNATFNAKILASKPISLKSWFPKLGQTQEQLNSQNLTRSDGLNTAVSQKASAFSPESKCLIERPQHYIYGKVLSLEAHSGGSLVFGFNQSVAALPLQASFSIDRMKMDMSMDVFDSWTQEKTQSQIASVLKKDFSLKVGIDLGIINIGPQIYRKTGLAEVTDQVVKNAITQTGKALNQVPSQTWTSRIVISSDNYVGILGGDELGIKIGDQFTVENENHSWLGEPCAQGSVIIASIATTPKPWIVEVDRIGTGISRARVLNENENESIRIGAAVKIHKLIEPQPLASNK